MQQKHLYSLKNNSTTLKILKLRLPFFILLHLLFGLAAVGQVSGDYRSTNTGAAVSPYYWNLKTSWEYYNGAAWIPATNYPGEIPGTGAVLIRTGDVINIGISGITTESMGTLTISGSLVMTGINTGPNGTNFFFDTQTIIVTPLLGTIIFNNKVNLKLPTTATLQVTKDTSQNPDYYGLVGDCNHNQDIFIGTNVYAYCNGGGSTELTFLQVMTEGGTPNAIATSNAPVCQGSPINLFGSYTGVQGTSATYSWSIVNPLGVITTTTAQNPTISNAVSGTYAITLTYSATYNGIIYSNSETIAVLVNAVPILTTPPSNQLDCEGSVVSFNVVAIGVGLTYVWQRKLPADASFSAIPAETNVSYPTPDKIRLQNVGSSLLPNGAQFQVVVSNSNGCSVTSTAAALSVNEIIDILPKETTVTQCYGTNYSYTVSTTYPANVLNYQWKSSIASGTWNVVMDGTHFSGAKTATLNIINGTPSESAEYRVYITFRSSGTDCSVSSDSRTRELTFLPMLLTPDAVATHPTCNTATGTITVAIQNATDTYSFDNGASYQGSTNIKSGLATGNYNVVIKNKGGCLSAAVSKGINAPPTTPGQPILSLPTSPTCANPLGSFTINNYNPAYVYAANPTVGVAISGNTITAPPGNYTILTTLGSCSSAPSSNVTITPLVTNTWANAAWSAGSAPTMNTLVVINSDYNTSTNGNLIACSVIINAGKKLTITADNYATIQNDLTVNGTLEVLDKGSLIMINDAGTVTNNGATRVYKFTSPFEKYDYVYWSTPVVSTNIASPFARWRTNYAYEFLPANFADANGDGFDDDGNDWSYASTMLPGRGYIIMTPTNLANYNNAVEEVIFSGEVKNGIVTTPIALTPNGVSDDDFNLVGNPYPSAISADAFINANISTNNGLYNTIDGTLYFWTHIGDISSTNVGPDGLNFSSDDYAVYTLAGGVGTSGNIIGGVSQGSNKPTGYIASGQGFFVEADRVGTLLFNNAMRVGTEAKNNQFYKLQSNNKKSTTTVKDRLWLNLQNDSKMFSQQLIGYFDNATLGFDKGYDGLFSDAGNYVNFYSFIDNDTYKIQGRSSFDKNDQVRLGYFSAVAGTFNINIDSKEGVFANTNQDIYLEDKVSNTIFDLKTGSYTFTTAAGTYNDRFVLRYTDNALGAADFEKTENQVVVSMQNEQIKITSLAETIDQVVVYDLSGKQCYQKRKVGSTEFLLSSLAPRNQMVLVKTVLQNGKSSTIKVLY